MTRFGVRVARVLERAARGFEHVAKQAADVRQRIGGVMPADEHVARVLIDLADMRRERDTLLRELEEEREERETAMDRAGVAIARANRRTEELRAELTAGETGRLRARGERTAELEKRLDERLADLVDAQQRAAVLEGEISLLHEVRVRVEREREDARRALAEAIDREQRRLNDLDELEAPQSTEGPS